jgi:hypothetical protein
MKKYEYYIVLTALTADGNPLTMNLVIVLDFKINSGESLIKMISIIQEEYDLTKEIVICNYKLLRVINKPEEKQE